ASGVTGGSADLPCAGAASATFRACAPRLAPTVLRSGAGRSPTAPPRSRGDRVAVARPPGPARVVSPAPVDGIGGPVRSVHRTNVLFDRADAAVSRFATVPLPPRTRR